MDWLVGFSEEPLTDAQRVPGALSPLYIVVVPLPGEPVVVRFLLAEQFFTILVKRIVPLP